MTNEYIFIFLYEIMMVEENRHKVEVVKLEKMASILKAISHPFRLEIIQILETKEPQSVAEILEQMEIEQSLLSHHLIKMKDKGVLGSHRKGRNIYYHLAFKEVIKIFDCMEQCELL